MSRVERVREALRGVVDPCSASTGSNLDVVEMGLVKDVDVRGNHVDVEFRLTTPSCHMIPYFTRSIEEAVGSLDGVDSVHVEADYGAEWDESLMSETARRKRRETLAGYEARYAERVEGD